MPSLLLVVFTLQVVLHLINTVGASSVDELVRDPIYSIVMLQYANMSSAMGVVQQASHANIWKCAEMPGAEEGDRAVEA